MAMGYILSINTGSDLERMLEPIAERVQAVHRRIATIDQLCGAMQRDYVACVVFEDAGKAFAAPDFCDVIEQHEQLRPSVMVVHEPEVETAVRAVRSGAVAVHRASIGVDELEGSIREALAVSALVRESVRRMRRMARRLDRLSEGELRVLRLVLEGYLNKRIASSLDVSERTVEARRKRIFEKTETGSVAQLVREIIETVGMNDILVRCGEPTRVPPAPHWIRPRQWERALNTAPLAIRRLDGI